MLPIFFAKKLIEGFLIENRKFARSISFQEIRGKSRSRGPNPPIVSYNASAVKIYSATSIEWQSPGRLGNKEKK
jgi:hypothetical protein